MKLQLYPPEFPHLPGPGMPASMSLPLWRLMTLSSRQRIRPYFCSRPSLTVHPGTPRSHTLSDQLLTSLSLPAVPSNAHSLAQRQERIAWQLPPELLGYTPPRQDIVSTIHCPT